jgi:hypothetical protein
MRIIDVPPPPLFSLLSSVSLLLSSWDLLEFPSWPRLCLPWRLCSSTKLKTYLHTMCHVCSWSFKIGMFNKLLIMLLHALHLHHSWFLWILDIIFYRFSCCFHYESLDDSCSEVELWTMNDSLIGKLFIEFFKDLMDDENYFYWSFNLRAKLQNFSKRWSFGWLKAWFK